MTIKSQLANLEAGKKYTLIISGEFGFLNYIPLTLHKLEETSYAQYKNAVRLTYRQKRKHKDTYIYLYSQKRFAIIEGHLDKSKELDIFTVQLGEPVHGTIAKTSRFSAFSPEWISEAVKASGQTPLVSHYESSLDYEF